MDRPDFDFSIDIYNLQLPFGWRCPECDSFETGWCAEHHCMICRECYRLFDKGQMEVRNWENYG